LAIANNSDTIMTDRPDIIAVYMSLILTIYFRSVSIC